MKRTRLGSLHSFVAIVARASGILLLGLAVARAADAPVVFLDQGWSQADRETYYQMSQGSAVLAYDIFMNLEVAGGHDLFRSDANSDHFGLTTQPANRDNNPDALPVGISKTVIRSGRWKGEYAGLTCAACHNGQLNYKGQHIRIEGGVGNTFDMMAYIYGLDDALQETARDGAKFDRLAGRVGATTPTAKADLRKRFETDAARVHEYRTRTLVTPDAWGPARMDAIGLIVNRVTSVEPRIPENWSTPLAPTKPPFLWNSPQGSWTQWRGVQQDPIGRNLIEVMGVFMLMDLHSKTPKEGLFDSEAQLQNLEKIEDMLARLAPPKWPEEVLGKIDRKKAEQGKALFAANCARCHNSYPYTWTAANKYGKRFIEVGMVPQKVVGTDPGQFDDLRPYALTGQLAPSLPGPFKDKALIPTGDMYYILSKEILGRALEKLPAAERDSPKLHGYRELPTPRPSEIPIYKAAPREGVWATPPFLHNGAVPNLYEMLVPAAERSKKFYLGREFDPVKVGLDTSGKSGKFLFDTAVRGNSNAGHSFQNGAQVGGVIGPLLTEEQRWALVEYLKSIPENAGQITPFGGPPDAKTGHGNWGTP